MIVISIPAGETLDSMEQRVDEILGQLCSDMDWPDDVDNFFIENDGENVLVDTFSDDEVERECTEALNTAGIQYTLDEEVL